MHYPENEVIEDLMLVFVFLDLTFLGSFVSLKRCTRKVFLSPELKAEVTLNELFGRNRPENM